MGTVGDATHHDISPHVVDLFCGVGGLTRGLIDAKLKVVAGYDTDDSCKFAYETNNAGAVFRDKSVADLEASELLSHYPPGAVRVLVGCAPCQPYSSLTQKITDEGTGTNGRHGEWGLLDTFANLIASVKPEIVSMENVTRLANKAKYPVYARFVDTLRRNGYFISEYKIYCPDYGIPQTRRRLVLLASRFGAIQLIGKTHRREDYVKVAEVIGDLEPLEAGGVSTTDPLHVARRLTEKNLRRIIVSKPGGSWREWDDDLKVPCHTKETGTSFGSVYGRMSWDEPSPTITTQFFNFGTGRFGHPEQNRAITLREGALLQTFPRDYEFVERWEDVTFVGIGRHIGNAVPVTLGRVIGESVMVHLKSYGVVQPVAQEKADAREA